MIISTTISVRLMIETHWFQSLGCRPPQLLYCCKTPDFLPRRSRKSRFPAFRASFENHESYEMDHNISGRLRGFRLIRSTFAGFRRPFDNFQHPTSQESQVNVVKAFLTQQIVQQNRVDEVKPFLIQQIIGISQRTSFGISAWIGNNRIQRKVLDLCHYTTVCHSILSKTTAKVIHRKKMIAHQKKIYGNQYRKKQVMPRNCFTQCLNELE